ncbi:hypothetical protein [Allomesorhizobium alhagi]|jgi:hypothetical protein|uniref:Uncharacterized protein n=1 Tax=Mesorhizobium alhagi CCNWXJ12-2 TaxID=1107882 RepID=H0HW05_9HYPH|nr:hypothetical protein [Mesorhizobium alhagi]EHK55083.1 hypothetical protein MAXJ12_21814 [Mesorhizobium alhagi CCNWXJ12-2]
MGNSKIVTLVALSLALGTGAAVAQDAAPPNPPSDAVVQYAKDFVAANLIGNAELNAAIVASTEKHRRLGYDETNILDGQWRVAKSGVEKEAKAASTLKELAGDKSIEEHVKAGEELIKAARENDASKWLIKLQEGAQPAGAVTEVFVMDGWGWNVAQTGGTSDFYQGDEGKWQKTFALNDIEILDIVEEDGIRYAQISLPIKDGDKNIGAVTVGVDVDKVK